MYYFRFSEIPRRPYRRGVRINNTVVAVSGVGAGASGGGGWGKPSVSHSKRFFGARVSAMFTRRSVFRRLGNRFPTRHKTGGHVDLLIQRVCVFAPRQNYVFIETGFDKYTVYDAKRV